MEKHKHEFLVDTSCDCGLVLSKYVQELNAHNAELVKALETMEQHLTALSIMCRDNTLYKWNSAGTVQTIHEARELIAKAKGDSDGKATDL